MKSFHFPKLITILSVITICFFMSAALFGILAAFSNDQMNHPMNNCPFVAGELALCPINLFNHISDWKELFSAAIPLLVVGFVLFIIARIFSHRGLAMVLSDFQRWRIATFSQAPPALQLAFADGILHPKLYA